MRIHVIEWTATPMDGCNGGKSFHTRNRDAETEMRKGIAQGYEAKLTLLNVKLTKQGVLTALRLYAGHPDNG